MITLRPTVKDAVAGPTYEQDLAYVEVLVGDKNRAIPRLQRLLKIPYNGSLTPTLLRLHPQWDPLRSDPAFQKTLRGKETVNQFDCGQLWIPTVERSELQTRIATTEGVSLP